MKSILEYNNYREYLKDLYEERKKNTPRYSYRKLSEDLGFNASNFLHLIITNKRNLSEDAVFRMQKCLFKTSQEKDYFSYLVRFNQESDLKLKNEYAEMMSVLKGQKLKMISGDMESYFSFWFIPVIREVLLLKDFVSEIAWIAHKIFPKISREDIKNGLSILHRLKMIQKDKGRWVQSEEHLKTPDQVTSDLLFKYHEQMLVLSGKALEISAEWRDVSSMTMGMTFEQFEKLKRRLAILRDEIQNDLATSNATPDLVAVLNTQLFPLTRVGETKKKSS